MKRIAEHWEYILGTAVLLLVPLHLCMTVVNFFHSIDKGYGHWYPTGSYAAGSLYLLVILAADWFMLRRRRFLLSREMRRYWAICCWLLLLVPVLLYLIPKSGSLAVILLAVTPYFLLIPLLELIHITDFVWGGIAAGLFCFLHWTLCRWSGGSPGFKEEAR